MQVGIWGWDEVVLPLTSQWRKIHVNAVGDVQVDVLTSALPLGAASAANQVIGNADLATLVAEQGRCYGWDSAAWQRLTLEGVGLHNLRVKLYDGANGIDSSSAGGGIALAARGLFTNSIIRAYELNSGLWQAGRMKIPEDNLTPSFGLFVVSHLMGFNGVDYDRLRSYGAGVLTVAKGAIAPTRIRMTATGRVGVAGAKKVFWIACSPDGPSAEWEITDADAGGGAIEYDHFDTDKHSDHIDFNPPMEFATGIWVEKFDHMKSLVFCYQ